MWFLFLSASASVPLTLGEAFQAALSQNLELRAARDENKIATWGLTAARGRFDPQLTGSARTGGSQTPTNNVIDGTNVVNSTSRSLSAGLSQSLPTGGDLSLSYSEYDSQSDSANAASSRFSSTGLNLSLTQPLLRGAGFRAGMRGISDAKLAVTAQELRWRQALNQLAVDVSSAYWGLVAARESLQAADRAVELAEQQLRETVERKQAGFAGSGDVLQVQLAVGQARAAAVSARATNDAAAAALCRITGRSLADAPELLPTDIPEVPDRAPAREQLLAAAEQSNVSFQLAKLQYERSQRDLRLAQNAALPDLNVNGTAGLAAGATDPITSRQQLFGAPAPSWGVGVSVGLPVFLGQTRAGFGIAKLRSDQAKARYEAAEQDLILAVDNALRGVERDLAGLEVAEQILTHAQLSLAVQRELLSEGRGSTRDVVDALESLRRAEAARLSAAIACQQSLNQAKRVGGTLLAPRQVTDGSLTP